MKIESRLNASTALPKCVLADELSSEYRPEEAEVEVEVEVEVELELEPDVALKEDSPEPEGV